MRARSRLSPIILAFLVITLLVIGVLAAAAPSSAMAAGVNVRKQLKEISMLET